MNAKLSFGKILGIYVYLHWTFSLLIIWIVYSNLKAGLDLIHALWSVVFVLSLFLCVTLHEFGHALAARRYGINTANITLYPIGGVASLEKMPENPKQELVVALAGPMVNFIIVLLISPIVMAHDFTVSDPEQAMVINAENFIPLLGVLNVWLAVFNLIPAFPMDGGRVLRALLSFKMNRVKATQIAARIGQVLAIGFIILGFNVNPFLIFIGIFIMLGAQAEAESVKAQSFISGINAGSVLMTNFETIEKNQPIGLAVKMLLDGQSKNFLITDNGNPYGMINRDRIIQGISNYGEAAEIDKITDTNLVFKDSSALLTDMLVEFQKSKASIICITQQNQFVGIVDFDNVTEMILINEARKSITI
jgi:Zn-dependent protease